MLSIIKFLLTWPYLVHLFYKSWRLAKKVKRDPEELPEEERYLWIKKRARYLCWLFGIKIKVHGLQNLPKNKSFILVSNHQSFFDPLILFKVINSRKYAPLVFIAKKELKQQRQTKNFLQLVNVLFIDRQNPRQALNLISETVKLLHENKRIVVIFPEGTRSHSRKINEFRGGVYEIATNAQVQVAPLSIVNSYNFKPKFKNLWKSRKTVHVVFHKSFSDEELLLMKKTLFLKKLKEVIELGVEKLHD